MRALDITDTTHAPDVLVPLVQAAATAEPRLRARVRTGGSPSPRLQRFTSPGHGGLTSNHVLARAVAALPVDLNGDHVPQLAGDEADALVAPLAPYASPGNANA